MSGIGILVFGVLQILEFVPDIKLAKYIWNRNFTF
jgi:hypothetical protein